MHWSEEIAEKIIARNPNKEEYVCSAGLSPSGRLSSASETRIRCAMPSVVRISRRRGDAEARMMGSVIAFPR